jgi:hypothetical protein
MAMCRVQRKTAYIAEAPEEGMTTSAMTIATCTRVGTQCLKFKCVFCARRASWQKVGNPVRIGKIALDEGTHAREGKVGENVVDENYSDGISMVLG